jgi:UDP-N-acetylmuramate dehydrogenase
MEMTERLDVRSARPAAELKGEFGDKLLFDHPLAGFSTYRTGGPAKYFISVAGAEELSAAVKSARKLDLEFFILGGGSNILIADSGYDGLVIKVDVQGLSVVGNTRIECGAGVDLMRLVEFSAEHGLTGLEFASGIAGSVGGALYGNAGAYGNEIGQVVSKIVLVTQAGEIKEVGPEYCRFAYRDSYLKRSRDVVVKAMFDLEPGNAPEISRKIADIVSVREGKLPVKEFSAGCFFKNIPDPKEKFGKLPAGRLLEEIGAKKMSVGGAKVYEKHANIIINTGTATSRDISKLAALLRSAVKDKFDIELEEEVIRIGNHEA